jgi:hypothetical protein
MIETLVVLFFGFPAAFLSLLLTAVGVRKERPWLVIVGAVLFVPFAYYLSGAPGSYRLPLLLPLLQAASVPALRAGRKAWAWVLLVPAFLAVLWVAVVALFYQVR